MRLICIFVFLAAFSTVIHSQTPVLTKEYIRLGGRTVAIENSGPPASLGSVTPATGTVSTTTFAATYTGNPTYQSLLWVEFLVATASDGGGQPFCYVHYDVVANQLWLSAVQISPMSLRPLLKPLKIDSASAS